MKETINVVILAAGLGTRMKSKKAKVLHEAGGDTLLNHVIRAALQITQPERIVAVVGHQADRVRESVRTAGVRFAEQREQKGTAHAVLCARDAVDSREGLVLVLNGDGPLLQATTLHRLVTKQSGSGLGATIVTTRLADPTGYGRILWDTEGMIAGIVEQKAATPSQLEIKEVNPGCYCFDAAALWRHIDDVQPNNPAHEYYITDMVEVLNRQGLRVASLLVEDETELLGINTRVELAVADKLLRARKAQALMLAGVTIEQPDTVTIDADVQAGEDSIVEANVQLRGTTRIGSNCRVGTGTVLRDCIVEDGAEILPYVVAENSVIGSSAYVGPFARLRMNAEVRPAAHVGNFVELKNTRLGEGSKANHLAYLGDASIGSKVNVGAGTITCNYDGERKHRTTIGEGAFVGSNSTLVAPLSIAEGAYIGAGSTITKDVESDSLALGRAHQVDKPGWAKKRRARSKELATK